MESWLLFAFLSAVFAGPTSILAKIGIRDIDSDLGTAIRTIVVLIMAWFMVLIVGSFDTIRTSPRIAWCSSSCRGSLQVRRGSATSVPYRWVT